MTAPDLAAWRTDAEEWHEQYPADTANPTPIQARRVLTLLEALAAEQAKAGRFAQLLGNVAAEQDDARLALARVQALVSNARQHAGGSHTANVDALSIERAIKGGSDV